MALLDSRRRARPPFRAMSRFGSDIIIAAGGSIVAHPQGPQAGATAFRQAIFAASEGMELRDATKVYLELRTAVDLWGGYDNDDPEYLISTR